MVTAPATTQASNSTSSATTRELHRQTTSNVSTSIWNTHTWATFRWYCSALTDRCVCFTLMEAEQCRHLVGHSMVVLMYPVQAEVETSTLVTLRTQVHQAPATTLKVKDIPTTSLRHQQLLSVQTVLQPVNHIPTHAEIQNQTTYLTKVTTVPTKTFLLSLAVLSTVLGQYMYATT